ncbi:MAG: hypothetical protein FJX78_00500 [Armatimonadetes bacterium]|nr:hypothetical protein [Armatimonadota bacterium]
MASLTDRALASGVSLVRVAYCDNANLIRAKRVPSAGIEDAERYGVGFSVAQQALPMMGDVVLPETGLAPAGEVYVMPETETFTLLPYSPGSALVLGDFVNADGTPWDHCQRTALKRVVAQAAEAGLSLRAADPHCPRRHRRGLGVPVDQRRGRNRMAKPIRISSTGNSDQRNVSRSPRPPSTARTPSTSVARLTRKPLALRAPLTPSMIRPAPISHAPRGTASFGASHKPPVMTKNNAHPISSRRLLSRVLTDSAPASFSVVVMVVLPSPRPRACGRLIDHPDYSQTRICSGVTFPPHRIVPIRWPRNRSGDSIKAATPAAPEGSQTRPACR